MSERGPEIRRGLERAIDAELARPEGAEDAG